MTELEVAKQAEAAKYIKEMQEATAKHEEYKAQEKKNLDNLRSELLKSAEKNLNEFKN